MTKEQMLAGLRDQAAKMGVPPEDVERILKVAEEFGPEGAKLIKDEVEAKVDEFKTIIAKADTAHEMAVCLTALGACYAAGLATLSKEGATENLKRIGWLANSLRDDKGETAPSADAFPLTAMRETPVC